MKITLQRNVKIESYEVLMDIGISRKKPVYLAILKAINETGGKANSDYIAKKLLGNRPKIAAENIIRRCVSLNLVNEKWELTDEGKKALETEMIFIPERGAYRIWITQDPFLPSRVIYKESIQEDDNINRIQFKAEFNPEFKKANTPLPQEILNLIDNEINLLGRSREFVKILEIYSQGRKISVKEDELILKIIVNQQDDYPKATINGELGNSDFFENKILSDMVLTWEMVWKNLLGIDYSRWDSKKKQLKIDFNKLSEKEKFSFLSTILFEKPQIQNYGSFDETFVENIPIVPIDLSQAQKWFDWLCLNIEPKTYCDKKRYEQFIISIKNNFIDFSDLLIVPEQRRLAELIKARDLKETGKLTKNYWRIQAPIDLELGG